MRRFKCIHVLYLYLAPVNSIHSYTMLYYTCTYTLIQLSTQCPHFNDNSAMTVFTKGPWFINDSEQQSLLSNGRQHSTSWMQTQFWSRCCQRGFKGERCPVEWICTCS